MALVPWFVVAFAGASLNTTYSALQKRLTLEYTGLELSFLTSLFGAAFMLPVGAWYALAGDVALTPVVVGATLLSGAVNVGALYAFLTALEGADLSVVAPLAQSTPVFVALAEPVALGVGFDPRVLAGAAVAVVGAQVVLADRGLAAPLANLTDRAALLAVAAAAMWAAASLANRFVTTRVPPLFYAFAVYLLMAVGFAAVQAARGDLPSGDDYPLVRGRLLALGGLTAARTSVTYVAFSLAIASRVSVVLQTAVVLDVLAGGVLFAEEGLARRLLGALCIVAGVVLTL